MSYKLLPFRFDRLDKDNVFLSNIVGEYMFLSSNDFDAFINKSLGHRSDAFLNLKAKQMLTDAKLDPVIDKLATKYRARKQFLDYFTSLHMVVPTLRCNSNCIYCQASRKNVKEKGCDMDKNTAKKIVNIIFQSPSPYVKIEFQGGEPLLNFDIVKYIVEYAESLNKFKRKHLEFLLCTNLTLITEKIIEYLKKHKIRISTSLDGPKDLHNKNRLLQGSDNSYDIVVNNIGLCRYKLGSDSVFATMTTSAYSLNRLNEVVDEYINQNFHSVVIRTLNPFGFAKRNKGKIGYNVETFINNYKKVLNYIIDLNLHGQYFVEVVATFLLGRILTPFSTGHVDMQSPAGTGISGVIYNFDGNVYVSDEARMLANMGDRKFLMGNVHNNSYQELFNSNFMHSLISSSCLEALPECAYCAYQSYCGSDPVRNYSEQGDTVGNKTTSEECIKNKGIIKYLLILLKENNPAINSVFWSWINGKPLNLTRKKQ